MKSVKVPFIALPLVVALVVVLSAIVMLRLSSPQYAVVSFGRGVTVYTEVAETPSQQQKGLGGRDSLAAREGMLFPINPPAVQTFWMKEMRFPLDILWLSNGTVIGFQQNAPAPTAGQTDLPQYRSPAPVDDVLEVKAGFISANGIKIGSPVTIDRQP